jgi:plasmid stabilization system protein ParE
MGRRVRWTETALSDVDQIAEYIARDSRFYAAAFVREVRAAARSLAHMPMRGRMVPEFGDASTREIFVTSHVAGGGARGSVAGPRTAEEGFLAWLGQYANDLEIIDNYRVFLHVGETAGSKGSGSFPERISTAYCTIFRAALKAMTSRPEPADDADFYTDNALRLAQAEGAELVVFGHTHGLKDIQSGGARYLNTGTWIGLVDLNHALLEERGMEGYQAFLNALRDQKPFARLKLLTFAEIAYPHERLDAGLRIWRNGNPHPVTAS